MEASRYLIRMGSFIEHAFDPTALILIVIRNIAGNLRSHFLPVCFSFYCNGFKKL